MLSPIIEEHAETRNASCRLKAQLARTEEAAKRALLRSDQYGAQGGAAARLLDTERQLMRVMALKTNMECKC